MSGQKPTCRGTYKGQEDQQWTELFAGWSLAKAEVSVPLPASITLDVDAINRVANGASKIKCLLVPNQPRAAKPAERPAANGNQRSGGRKRAGPQPV